MAGDINKDPFFVIDDSGSLQNLLVVKRGSGSSERVLPYSLAELVSSSVAVEDFGVLTSSIKDISSSLASISSSTGVSSSLEQIYGQLTASYRYATASYNQLTASSQYLSSISSSISSSNTLLSDVSSSIANTYNSITASLEYATASYNELTASNIYLSSISSSVSSSNALLTDISSSEQGIYNQLTSSNKYLSNISSSISSSNLLLVDVSGALYSIYGNVTASLDYLTASYAQLTSSNLYLSDISSSISSSSAILSDISSSDANIYNQLTASYSQLTSSNKYLSSISGTLSSSYTVLSDISSSDALVYSTLTASYDKLSGSYDELTASNLNLVSINTAISTLSESADTTYNYLTASINTITASLSQSSFYIKQLAAYARATAVRSTILDLPAVQATKDLATVSELIPGGVGNAEEYLRACVDVLIQNSTNKHCYVKISHLPGATVNTSSYTIKLPPGVIYNSDSQLASMRHVVYVSESADAGEVSAMLTYNTTLLTDAAYPPLVGPNTIYSLAVNNYDFYDNKALINEWHYGSQDIYNKFTVTGQARVNNGPSQYFKIYITPAGSSVPTGSVTIVSSTAQDFSIEVLNPPDGNYELIADSTDGGLDSRGDGRILFADVLIQSSSIP